MNLVGRIFVEITTGAIGVFASAFLLYCLKSKIKNIKICCGCVELIRSIKSSRKEKNPSSFNISINCVSAKEPEIIQTEIPKDTEFKMIN